MLRPSTLRLIDLLSLRPGSLLHLHAVTGEAVCQEAETLHRYSGWQENVSHAVFPGANPAKVHNFQKLLDIPIEAQVIVRHTDGKVVEILRLNPHTWDDLMARAGYKADVMVDGKVIAIGEIVDGGEESGIRIRKVLNG